MNQFQHVYVLLLLSVLLNAVCAQRSWYSNRIDDLNKDQNNHGRSSSKMRLCEIRHNEYIQRIFPGESDTAIDANDLDFDGRILAAPGKYPHMTAIGFASDNDDIDYKCGGSLISDKFVITAAHCTNVAGAVPTKARMGDLNLVVEESYLEPQIRDIMNIFVHPNYKTSSYYNDIAILELLSEVELTEFIRPIRLWIRPTLPFAVAYATGYGSTDFARERTNRLTDLNMTILTNEECNSKLPVLPETENGIVESQICGQDLALHRDTCQGDSGGPLQLNVGGRRRRKRLHYYLIGITSYGLACRSEYPGVYTRVYSYLDWIEKITAIGFASDNDDIDYKCGGSLISDKFVITAAHCTNVAGAVPTKARMGDLNLVVEESYLEPQIRDIMNIFVHPNYKTSSYYNDIAILELLSEVELTEFIRPIRLWIRPTLPFAVAYATGYGSTDFARERTNRLTDLNMTILTNEECNSKLPVLPETENGIVESQICGQDLALHRDTCQGDSGGPLQLNVGGRRRRKRLHYYLIGITSYGLACRSEYPGVYTRVYSYLDWIEKIVWNEDF